MSKTKRSFEIRDAVINDDFCNYTYKIIEGIGVGFAHSVKGVGIIKDSLRKAFSKLNIHLAVIDDAFKYSGIEIEDIDKHHGDELTQNFYVTGFKIKGGEEDQSVILIGTKYVSTASGRMEIDSPKIALDKLSSYKWYNELKTAIEKCRNEVARYHEGNYDEVEPEEKEDPNQLKITATGPDGVAHDIDLESARV